MNNLETTLTTATESNKQHIVHTPFFAVSLTKLVVLSICTLGLYQIYWFYQNWCLIKEREQLKITPLWRAIFSIFYCQLLFEKIANSARDSGGGQLPAASLSSAWIISQWMLKLPGWSWLCISLNVVFLIPIQKAVNRINQLHAPDHHPNTRWSVTNIFTMLIGMMVQVLMLKLIFTL